MNKLRPYLRTIRPLDWVIVLALMVGSFIPYLIFARHEEATQVTTGASVTVSQVAVIKHDGQVVKTMPLTEKDQRFTYRDGHAENAIEVKDGKIRITEANCQDQVCVRQGAISKAGQTIVCLPHKLLIEVQSGQPSNSQGLVSE